MAREGASTSRFARARSEAGVFAEFFAVCGLAVAQPTLDLLGRNAQLFIAWGASTWRILAMTLIIIAVPPMALWSVEFVIGLIGPRTRSAAHSLLLGSAAAVLAVTVLKHIADLAPWLLVASAIVAGTAFTYAIGRFSVARTWLRVLALAPVAFAALFLFASPATQIVFAPDASVAAVPVAHPHRVVLLVLDEFPLESLLDGSGHIDAGLYPNFAALSAGATWYRNETTVAPYTEAAVPAIVSGLMPTDPDAVPAVTSYPRNLFTMLGGSYHLNVHESVTRLCPTGLCPPTRRLAGIHAGFSGMMRDVADIWEDLATPGRSSHTFSAGIGGEDYAALNTGQEFVRSLRPATRPTLDFGHVLLPHFPWHYLPTGQDYTSFPGLTPGLDPDGRWIDASSAAATRTRHLLQVGAADRLVGAVLAKLRAIGALDDSLVIVTADHGVAFHSPLPFRGVARATYPSIMWTPLFVKYPGQRVGVVDDRPALSIDVVPTVTDVLGIRAPWRLPGRSLRRRPRAEGLRPLFEWSSNAVQPRSGTKFLEFDGRKGFQRVMAAKPVPGAGADPLRIYRRGRYGALVGTSAWTHAHLGPEVGTATIVSPLPYQYVDHRAASTPWATVGGRADVPDGRWIALAANGVIAGFYRVGAGAEPHGGYGGIVAPVLHDGRNLLQLFLVKGPTANPAFDTLRILPG